MCFVVQEKRGDNKLIKKNMVNFFILLFQRASPKAGRNYYGRQESVPPAFLEISKALF